VIVPSLSATPPVAGVPTAPGGPCADLDVARVAAEVRSDVDATADRLEELERLQALVVSTTAHELRTPLTVLRVHADLLIERGGTVDADERQSLEAIRGAVERLQAVSDHLVAELRETAGGAEGALRRWLQVDDDAGRMPTRPS
jgi:signal transduction histidine kinase